MTEKYPWRDPTQARMSPICWRPSLFGDSYARRYNNWNEFCQDNLQASFYFKRLLCLNYKTEIQEEQRFILKAEWFSTYFFFSLSLFFFQISKKEYTLHAYFFLLLSLSFEHESHEMGVNRRLFKTFLRGGDKYEQKSY